MIQPGDSRGRPGEGGGGRRGGTTTGRRGAPLALVSGAVGLDSVRTTPDSPAARRFPRRLQATTAFTLVPPSLVPSLKTQVKSLPV